MNAVERRKVWLFSSWLISAIVHFALTAIVAVVLRPVGQGESSANTLVVSMTAADPLEMELATFTAGPPVTNEFGAADFLLTDATGQAGEFDLEVELVEAESASAPRIELLPTADAEVPAPRLVSPNRREELPEAEAPPAKAEFFGTVAKGDRFVYLLDMSGSMNCDYDNLKRSRFDRARDELIRSIEQLSERQSFCVTLFSNSTRPMFGDRKMLKQYLKATPKNKERLKDWLQSMKPNGGTEPNEALATSVELSPSAIFLLSDGAFDVNQKTTAGLMFRKAGGDRNEIIDRSDERRIPIHTIAFEDAAGAKNMQDLSKGTGGSYRFVPYSPVADPAAAPVVARLPPSPPPSPPAPPTPEQLAARLLAVGKGHESLGRPALAAECYRKVAAQYPTSPAAKEAAERASKLAKAP